MTSLEDFRLTFKSGSGYKVDYALHNLDRAKNQLALVGSIFNKFDEIEKVIRENN